MITTETATLPTLPPTRLEISLSPGLFWPIYIPLVAIAIAIVGSQIYFKHQTLLLEHKRLDKEIQSIKAGTVIAFEKIKTTDPLGEEEVPGVVAVEKIKETNLLDEGEVQGAVEAELRW